MLGPLMMWSGKWTVCIILSGNLLFWGYKITRLSLYSYITHFNKFCAMFVSFSLLVAGLIHANHGGKIIEYLLQQLKNATSDVSFTSA